MVAPWSTSCTRPSRLTIPTSVLFRDLGGECVLLDLTSGSYFGLDQVGARIWALIAEHGELDRVRQALLAEFEVDPREVERDLERFVGELAQRGLVVADDR